MPPLPGHARGAPRPGRGPGQFAPGGPSTVSPPVTIPKIVRGSDPAFPFIEGVVPFENNPGGPGARCWLSRETFGRTQGGPRTGFDGPPRPFPGGQGLGPAAGHGPRAAPLPGHRIGISWSGGKAGWNGRRFVGSSGRPPWMVFPRPPGPLCRVGGPGSGGIRTCKVGSRGILAFQSARRGQGPRPGHRKKFPPSRVFWSRPLRDRDVWADQPGPPLRGWGPRLRKIVRGARDHPGPARGGPGAEPSGSRVGWMALGPEGQAPPAQWGPHGWIGVSGKRPFPRGFRDLWGPGCPGFLPPPTMVPHDCRAARPGPSRERPWAGLWVWAVRGPPAGIGPRGPPGPGQPVHAPGASSAPSAQFHGGGGGPHGVPWQWLP